LPNEDAEEEKAMFSGGFCVAIDYAQGWICITLRRWQGRGLSFKNGCGTYRARIADSPPMRLRSPQHLALS
jgi:hypothetical protein